MPTYWRVVVQTHDVGGGRIQNGVGGLIDRPEYCALVHDIGMRFRNPTSIWFAIVLQNGIFAFKIVIHALIPVCDTLPTVTMSGHG